MLISLTNSPSTGGGSIDASLPSLPKMTHHHLVFKGSLHNPLLAPRGVWSVDGKLMVSDTGQNRVFIWNEIPTSEFEEPSLVLGQIETTDTGRNAGHQVNASTLQYPSGIWSDGKKLIIADAWNHRVLVWHSMPSTNGQAADVVIGQPDFMSNQPNNHQIGANPTAQTLNWPYGVFSDGTHLWICDTGNRRVLFYEKIPTENFKAADEVIGKSNFFERDYEDFQPIWPYSARINEAGQMAVADTQYYRVLIWNDWRTANQQNADVIIGQPDFSSNGQNQYSLFPKPNAMNWLYDTFFYEKGIFVVDTGNSRVLWFKEVPKENNASADNVLGQFDFNTGSENSNTKLGTDKQLYWPFSICVSKQNLILADTGNHRVILYQIKN
ncbi:NHL repeat-containing protein [Arcicella rigui]|uniref:NHL repeat containing protein n=1 Tax=Arcicella rigui TaxID=797020 RepID=A0ABU5Q725_9BACT|nr:hypothetical protein [Arcicella rigui]MEA5138645.1 hypothetical protein [Arcicella rigui]